MNTLNQKYNSADELEKGADVTVVSYDRTQGALATGGKVTVGGKVVTAEIKGVATGKGVDANVNLWLSRFSFRKPDGSTIVVPDLNVPAALAPGQGAISTARKLASFINSSKAPYKATPKGTRASATLTIVYKRG